ncbi:PAS domain S-box protein [Thermodesulfobacteriota bacterium]
MAANPTFEELLMKVNELEEKITDCKLVEEALKESEGFSSSLLENSPDAIIVYNTDSSVRYVNPAFEKITGYTSKEALGTKLPYPWWVDEPDYGTAEQRGKLGLRGLYRTERRYRKKNGDYFYVELYVTPVYHEGELSYSFSTWTDITERKRIEEDLTISEERYREIVENSDDFITKVDGNGKFTYVNPKAAKILGLPQNDIIGMSAFDFVHPDEREKVKKRFADTASKQEKRASFEGRIVSKDGKIYYLHRASNFYYDNLGNLSGETTIARDLTKRIEMENVLKKARDDLEERVKERTRELKKANESLHEKTVNLQDVNTALKVLLEKRDRDKEENGEKVLLNVKELLVPYVKKLKNGPLTESQSNYIELLESGLNDIISPFAQKLTSRYMHITPRELQVANFVKEGKTSKEIAEILNCTERTIVAHRANLRKKFGLEKKSNLRTYLLTMQ